MGWWCRAKLALSRLFGCLFEEAGAWAAARLRIGAQHLAPGGVYLGWIMSLQDGILEHNSKAR